MPDTMISPETLQPQSPGVAKLAAALAEAQKNFAPIPKDREVTVHSDRGNYKFKYATLDAIRSATMPALAAQGLAVVQGMTEQGNGYAVETKLLHSSGEWVRNVTPMFVSGRVKDGRQYPPTNQELGSAQSYARRYGLSALLCITADEDDDGNTADGNHIEGSQRVPYKPRPGSAGGGSDFRPAGRRFSMDKAEGETNAQNGGGTPAPKTAPPAGDAIKRIEWVKASVAALKGMNKTAATDWWATEKKRIAVIETALPTEYERLLDAYNEAIERGEAA